MAPPLLELEHITKRYPGIVANQDVSLAVAEGEIQALLGENGAGKSTLMKIVYGLVQPDEGTLRWKGAAVTENSPVLARQRGVGMVFQHFTLFETLTVAENIALGLAPKDAGPDLPERIRELATRYGLAVEPRAPVWSLSVGERQRVEIVRCLLQSPRLLIMDEPTSVLTPQEADGLFRTLRKLAGEGCAVLYISHKLDEIRGLCQSATVLRGGKVVARCDPRRESAASLAAMMIGKAPTELEVTHTGKPGGPVLIVGDLSLASQDTHGTDLRSIALDVRAGEIVGIAGVAGNGQRELLRALSGEDARASPGAIVLDGTPVGQLGPRERRDLGLAFVPEERLGRGAAPRMSLTLNALLTARPASLTRHGLIDTGATAQRAGEIVRRFDVRTAGISAEAGSLSGGNLQKFIVGREMFENPKLLILAHPTWGVDVGAATLIREQMVAMRDRGAALLLFSEELDELFLMSDRIGVMFHGRLSPLQDRASLTRDEVGLLMGGAGFGMVDGVPLQLRLTRRERPSRLLAITAPLIAVLLTLVVAAIIFVLLGKNPAEAFYAMFWRPVQDLYGLTELGVKATPLILCAVGLAVGFRAQVWNIGAEGQLTVGAVAASGVALLYGDDATGWLPMVLCLGAGILGGMVWGAIPALLRTRFNANEILVSLMLAYVGIQVLDYVVHGPWKDPMSFGFPQSRTFPDATRLPILLEGTRLHLGLILAIVAALLAWVFVMRSYRGFVFRVSGEAEAAAAYAGFSRAKVIWGSFLIGGGLAGLAGAVEVLGPIGQLQPQISPGYGFAAIIVAFLGRLHPLGILAAAALMGLLYLGGETAQLDLQLPIAITAVFQGLLLFFLLGADTFVRWRLVTDRRA